MPSSAIRTLLLGLLAAAACTPYAAPRDPFAGGTDPARDGVRRYRVRLEVACDGCLVAYTVGPGTATDRATGVIWSRAFDRYPLMREAIRLTASSDRDGGPVRFVRIYVDGELLAEDECACEGLSGVVGEPNTLTTETVIPPG